MLEIALAKVWAGADAGDAHLAHMTLHGFAIDDELMLLLEHHGDAARAIRRLVGIQAINGMLDGDFLGRGRKGLIVETSSAQAEQDRLLAQRQVAIFSLDQRKALTSGQGEGQIFFGATRPGS